MDSLSSINLSHADSITETTPQKPIASASEGLFEGHEITQTDSHEGEQFKSAVKTNAEGKFSITSSSSLETRISIPETHEARSNLPSSVEELSPSTSPIDYLQTKGISVDASTLIGKGTFGKVYAANSEDKQYVFKQEMNFQSEDDPRVLNNANSNNNELNNKPWRDGDIAASRLKDLPNFAKTALFFLEITLPEAGAKPQVYSVPADQTKNFLKNLPPQTTIKKMGQLIERAPGKELDKLFEDPSFEPTKHFDAIANSLFGFLEKSFARNLIHRDLKPGNFIYDPTTKQGTVIDMGIGGVYRARHKMELDLPKTEKPNPFFSQKESGTPGYRAPAVIESFDQPYSSEVDFHSAALMLIKLLDPNGFEKARPQSTTPEVVIHFKEKYSDNPRPRTSTKAYVDILGADSNLANVLQENPNMQKTIDLFFNVAAASPAKRNEAFQELKNHIETAVRPAL